MNRNELIYLAVCVAFIVLTVTISGTVDIARLCVDHWIFYSLLAVGVPVVVIWNRKKQ